MPAPASVIPAIPKVPKVKLPKAKVRPKPGTRGVAPITMSERLARARAVEALSRDILATFGERDALVHFFARKKWTQVEGGNWRSEGGRVLSDASYKKLQQRLGRTGGGEPKPAAPAPAAAPSPAPAPAPPPVPPGVARAAAGEAAAGRSAAVAKEVLAGTRPLPPGWTPEMAKRAVQLTGADLAKAKGQTQVATTPAVQPGGLRKAAPPPTPAEAAHIDAAVAKDTARFGARAAGILHKAANAVRSLLATAVGGLTAANGAAYGALGGLALGGPLGLALGTAVGGGLGMRAFAPVAKKTYAMLGGKGRALAMARQATRKAVPPAVGLATGAPWLLGGMAASGGGALAAGVPGLVAGMVPAGYMAGQAAETAANNTKFMRKAMSTSRVSARKAERKNDTQALSERFAEDGLPPNAAAILKARLRVASQKAGVTLPPIPDEVVAAALRMASEDDRVATMSEFCREFRAFADAMTRVHSFAWKRGKRARYWLPDGKPDIPRNRKYGKAAEAAASAGDSSQTNRKQVVTPEPRGTTGGADGPAKGAGRGTGGSTMQAKKGVFERQETLHAKAVREARAKEQAAREAMKAVSAAMQPIAEELRAYGGTPADPGAGLRNPRFGLTAKAKIEDLVKQFQAKAAEQDKHRAEAEHHRAKAEKYEKA